MFGRHAIVEDLLDGYLHKASNPDPPVIHVHGPRGSGKTVLLEHLRDHQGQRVPCAYFDLNNDMGSRDLLDSLRTQLERKVRATPRIRFPHVLIGIAAANAQLCSDDRQGKINEMRKVVNAGRLRKIEAFAARAESPSDAIAAVNPRLKAALGIITAIFRWLATPIGARVYKRGLHFYKIHGVRPAGTYWDGLLDLNEESTAGSADLVTETLARALVMDLDQTFHRGVLRSDWKFNGLVLLDNAHTSIGQRFIELLDDARTRLRRSGASLPLVLVAAHQNRPPEGLAAGSASVAKDDRNAGVQHLRVVLENLSLSDVREMVVAKSSRGNVGRVSDFVYGLTGGQPAFADLVVEALVKPPADLRAILGQRLTDGTTVGDRALSALLGESARQRIDVLAMCSVAHDEQALNTLTALRQGTVVSGRDLDEARSVLRRYWTAVGVLQGAESEVVSDPVLRRLLQYRLAVRERGLWNEIHAELAKHHSNRGEHAWSWRHLLAGDKSYDAVIALADAFPGSQASDRHLLTWWDATMTVAGGLSAALAAGEVTEDADAYIDSLLAGQQPGRIQEATARLVGALQLQNDPLWYPRVGSAKVKDPARELSFFLSDQVPPDREGS